MLDVIALVLMALCGAVMLLAALLVLHACRAFEISLRSVAAILVGLAGAWYVAQAMMVDPVSLRELLLPVAIVLYIAALWRKGSRDSGSPGAMHLSPWAGGPGKGRS